MGAQRSKQTRESVIAWGFFDGLRPTRPLPPRTKWPMAYWEGRMLAQRKLGMWVHSTYAKGRSYAEAILLQKELAIELQKTLDRAYRDDGTGIDIRPPPCVDCEALALCAAYQIACNSFSAYNGQRPERAELEHTPSGRPRYRTVPDRETFEALGETSAHEQAWAAKKA